MGEGIEDTLFPNADNPIEIGAFRYDAKRMGGAPTITASVNYPTCLDDEWMDLVYAELNGEKYFLKQTPTSSKSNEDSRYKHDLELVAERIVLDDAYFYDAVIGDPLENDKPVTNSTKFNFYGSIADFVKRMNASLQYTGIQKVDENGNVISGYHVVLDEDVVTRDQKQVSFDSAVFSQALQEAYNTFGVPFYFDGKTIHVGFSNNIIEDILEYGVDGALLSATKQNANFKVINRATGNGSSDNIPYYYPNNAPKGEIECELSTSSENFAVEVKDYDLFSEKVKLDTPLVCVGGSGEFLGFSDRSFGVPIESHIYENFIINKTRTFNSYIELKSTSIGKIKILLNSHQDGQQDITSTIRWVINDAAGNEIILENGDVYEFTFDEVGKTYKIPVKLTIYPRHQSFSKKWISYLQSISIIKEDVWEYQSDYVNLEDIGLSYVGTPNAGDIITQRLIKKVNTSSTLQPSIYRATDGKERFYNAINYPFPFVEGYELKYGEYVLDGEVHNDAYKKDDGTYYEFTNEYKEGRPREHVFTVDDIKPTIKEMTNSISWVEQDAEGNNKTVFQRIDMFSEFAYNIGDNDETYTDPDGNTSFKHPYFFGKLRKLGFNLFDSASEMGEMTFSMTSGNCGACNFKIGVSEDYPQYNTVQVWEEDTTDANGVFHKAGSLKYDENGYVLCGLEDFQSFVEWQERQQDTVNYEVWIALKKEEDTYGILMPKAPTYEGETLVSAGHRPVACSSENANDGDTFVILNITLPKEYILHAEQKLEKAIIKYIWENNVEKFNFSVNFSRIFLEENPSVLAALNENARLTRVKYNGDEYVLYVSSYSYSMNEGDVLPEIRIELDDTLTISQNALQNAIDSVKSDVANAINAIDLAAIGSRYFLRKDTYDVAEAPIGFKKGVIFGDNSDVEVNEDGTAKLTIDYLEVTRKATFTSLEIQEVTSVGGQILVTPAAMICNNVEELEDVYRCYFESQGAKGEEIYNQFSEGDQAISQTFNEWGGHYYWRLVVGVGENYIDLSKVDCAPESDIPSEGDKIIQLGNRVNEIRQNAIAIAAYGDDSPYIIQYKGINSFEIGDGNIVTKLSSTENIFTGKVHIELGSDGVENLGIEVGGQNMLRNSGFTGDYLSAQIADQTVLDQVSETFNPPLVHWDATNATVQDSTESQSGKEVLLSEGSIAQTLYQKVIANESYMLSFKAKGTSLTYSLGGVVKTIGLTDEWVSYVEKIEAVENGETLSITNATCNVCDLQLERGTVASSWGNSYLDNASDRLYYQAQQYVSDALKDAREGSTDIYGGLVLTRHIKVGDGSNNAAFRETGGMSGYFTDSNSPYAWAGGDFNLAVETASKYQTTTATPEGEIPYVVTHGGKVVLNDAIVRGKIYATDGEFKGNISAMGGNIGLLNISVNPYDGEAQISSEDATVIGRYDSVTITNKAYHALSSYNDKEGQIRAPYQAQISGIGFKSSRGWRNELLEQHAQNTADIIIEHATEYGWDGSEVSIRVNSGTFEGLRPATRVVDVGIAAIDEFDHSILVSATNTGACNISLPSNPLNGQEYWIETLGLADLNISSKKQIWSHIEKNYVNSFVLRKKSGVIRFKYYATANTWTFSWMTTY